MLRFQRPCRVGWRLLRHKKLILGLIRFVGNDLSVKTEFINAF